MKMNKTIRDTSMSLSFDNGLFFDEAVRTPSYMDEYRNFKPEVAAKITDIYVKEWWFCLEHPLYKSAFLRDKPKGPLRFDSCAHENFMIERI